MWLLSRSFPPKPTDSTMATMLETPSRIWRRIEAAEAREMPSLPSLPPFEDSGDLEESSDPNQHDDEDNYDELFANISSPMQSTPTSSHNTVTSTFRGPPSATSTARFAHSIASPCRLATHAGAGCGVFVLVLGVAGVGDLNDDRSFRGLPHLCCHSLHVRGRHDAISSASVGVSVGVTTQLG